MVLGLSQDCQIVICRLAEAEVSSALARRRKAGSLNPAEYASAIDTLRRDLQIMRIVELPPALFSAVHSLLDRHALRAADALQLSAALTLRDRAQEITEDIEFVCHDERLRSAARAEGLRVLP